MEKCLTSKKPITKRSVSGAEKLNKAIQFSRSANNKTKGITVLDFDDTLATTKSGVRAKIPNILENQNQKEKLYS